MLPEEPNYIPYAPPGNVLTVIQRLRQTGLKEVLTNQELARLGIPEGTTPRVTKALRFLGLVDEESRQTQLLQRLGRAATEDYPKIMAEILEAAYEDIFAILDPGTATDIQLSDAFRGHDPEGQRDRMVNLFLSLCREAELVSPDRTSAPRNTVSRATSARPATSKPRVTTIKKPLLSTEQKNTGGQNDGPPLRNGADDPAGAGSQHSHAYSGDPRYQLLLVLLKQLPENGQWTQKRRDQWLGAVTANVDLLIEVVEPEDQNQNRPQPSLGL